MQTNDNENPYSDRYHELALSYKEYLKLDSNLERSKIGKYYIYGIIGSGAFGNVYKAMDD
jgi:hypothetical protein